MSSTNRQEIVILGGSFGAISAAHYVLRHVVPRLNALNSSTTYHVTMVSPSTHAFFKIGAPRVLVSPDLIPFSKAFRSIEDAFKGYPSGQFRFIQGSAKEVDAEKKVVTLEDGTTLSYVALVIATGTKSNSRLWTLDGPHEQSVQAHKDVQAALPNAKTVMVAGGGPAGVESTGEIASRFPAKVTIVSGSTRLLTRAKDESFGHDAEKRLKDMGVEVINNVKVAAVKEGKPTEVTLSDGTTRQVDLYIDATGGRPNSAFVPSSWLNEKGQILNDYDTMRVTVPGVKNVYAIGDVASYSTGAIMDVNNAVPPLGTSLYLDLEAAAASQNEKAGESQGGLLSWIFPSKSTGLKQKRFKPMSVYIVPIGPKGGVGILFGHRVPSLMVWAIKCRDYLIGRFDVTMSGSDYAKP